MAPICYMSKLLELAQLNTCVSDLMEYDPLDPSGEPLDTRPYDPMSPPTPPNSPRDPMAYDPEDPMCEDDEDVCYDPESPSVVDSHALSPVSSQYWPTSPVEQLG